MSLAFLFGFIGLIFAGFRGFLLGAGIGFLLSRIARAVVGKGLHATQSHFLESTFAVVGAVCKADGVVSREEIRVVEGLFERFHLSPEQREKVKVAFSRGKAPEFDLDAEVDSFARSARGNRVLLQMFLRVQLTAAAADGRVHPAEHKMLLRIAHRLGCSAQEIAELELLLRMAASGRAPGSGSGGGAYGGASPKQQLADAYTTLGVSPDVDQGTLKRAYRKLMRDNHPDRVAAKGLPPNMREVAEQRSREINTAYDLIKSARGFA